MYELLYTSVSSSELSHAELIELLEEARLKNKALNITGMLIYENENRDFIQLLEGSEVTVKELYQTIREDQRHTSVDVFYEGNIDKRAFLGWSMAFKMLDDNEKNQLIPDYEQLRKKHSLRNLIIENANIGKELFLYLRNQLRIN